MAANLCERRALLLGDATLQVALLLAVRVQAETRDFEQAAKEMQVLRPQPSLCESRDPGIYSQTPSQALTRTGGRTQCCALALIRCTAEQWRRLVFAIHDSFYQDYA